MKPQISDEKRRERWANSSLDTLTVLARLKEQQPEVWEQAEVVGKWVWITFEMKPAEQIREYLLDLGFHWNHTRSCWQHSCGHYTRHTSGDPRWKYGNVPAKALDQPDTIPA